MDSPLPITGSYSTTFGTLRLEARGDKVTGRYTHQDGSVVGTLQGTSLRGTWVQKGNASEGTFSFEFDRGANGFRGTWEGGGSGPWNGVRLELAPADRGGFPGGWNSLTEGPLLAGPMIGEVSPHGAWIWAQARCTSPLTLVVATPDGEVSRITRTPAWNEWLCQVFHVEDLRPGVPYTYWLESTHGKTPARPLSLAPAPDTRAVRIAFGSCLCFYHHADLPILEAIERDAPACLAMIGDNTYYYSFDWQSEHAMMLAQLRARNNPSFRRLVAALPTVGVWDDHDFGPNDADNRFSGKDMAFRAFRRSWANARWGTNATAGVFSSVRMGPAELFLLDSRWYRNQPAHTLLGESQLVWLVESLARSTAPVKIIASPTQVLADAAVAKEWECFRRDAPQELEGLLGEIEARDIRGVVFVSGDLHMANLFHQEGRDLHGRRGPEWWELTTSPLANDPWMESIAGKDRYLVAEVVDRCNYGLIDIDLDRAGSEVLLVCKDEKGRVLFDQPIALPTLAVRR
ncbi:alkaline phosphatase D family protein [Polyangium fumosum]|uniref:Alkaline phosphatase family protein n=1 Tax=Polyangium fumosum TaxID=889272 RepID=A0A4U1IEM6_9BACT|nr:alkaline phosphatase D family protein [Polyangium fumosum]TKC92118.1 alkaline phosphatase family protein [Polyangium fumosum]